MTTIDAGNGKGSGDLGLIAHFDARRIIPTSDFVSEKLAPSELAYLLSNEQMRITQFCDGMNILANHFGVALKQQLKRALPGVITGTIVQPDGSPGGSLAVRVDLPDDVSGTAMGITDDTGYVRLQLPAGAYVPYPATAVKLIVRGSNGTQTLQITFDQFVHEGIIASALSLSKTLDPLPTSVVSDLFGIVASLVGAQSASGPSSSSTSVVPSVRLGQDECSRLFGTQCTQERFPYNVLVRLVEPQTSIQTRTFEFGGKKEERFSIALWNQSWKGSGTATGYAGRVPVDQPISVDGFSDAVMGISQGFSAGKELWPMAGTLGLGYVVTLAQRWQLEGYSLGNLVYSLPLAPGEQQRVAVFEQAQSLNVFEGETFSQQQQQQSAASADSSTQAIFSSAFDETVNGHSDFRTDASSSGWAVGGGIGLAIGPLVAGVGGGYSSGSSSSNGSSNQSLDGTRNYVSNAAQTMHTAAEQQASARRTAQRTGMRLATESDVESGTTKIITNNNRNHALTMQYWEVLRDFHVSTTVEGVQLVCMVPLEVIRFLPAQQPVSIDDADLSGRSQVLARYGQLLRNADVLLGRMPLTYRDGLVLLERFAADPNYSVESSAYAENVLRAEISGTFMPFERVSLTIVTNRGTRVGPLPMSGKVEPLPDRNTDSAAAFASRAELLQYLRARRAGTTVTLSANFALPQSLAPSDITGFELTRNFDTLSYQLAPRTTDPISQIFSTGVNESLPAWLSFATASLEEYVQGVTMTPTELEQEIGGPRIADFSAYTRATNDSGRDETLANGYLKAWDVMPPGVYPIPALEVKPMLRKQDLLKIERTLQHVMRNSVAYSKAVWVSLSAEERAIMLEPFTIGVASGGLPDASTHIPLLNCVANTVLGFFGNSMVMPFSIPWELAQQFAIDNPSTDTEGQKIPLTTSTVQNALAAYYGGPGAVLLNSDVALPTRGVLGEAVLGHCASAEKIDLTRFWNWADSPIPQADDVTAPKLNAGTNSILSASAPNSLTNLPNIINNVATPPPFSDALTSLITKADTSNLPDITGSKDLATLLGTTLNNAEKARADALAKTQSLAQSALQALPGIMNAQKGGATPSANGSTAKGGSTSKTTGTKANQKSGYAALKANASSLLDTANGKSSQVDANTFASNTIADLVGGDGLPTGWASMLMPLFTQTLADGTLTQGATAFIAALTAAAV